MINYFSCHFLLMLSYHLLRYSLSLRSSISTIQYLNQQFNTDIPSQDHFIIVKSGTGFFWIFLLRDWDFQCSSCIFSIHVATFWRFQILLKLKIWKAKWFDICWRGWNIQTQIETVQSHGLAWVSSDFPKIILTQQVKNIFVK